MLTLYLKKVFHFLPILSLVFASVVAEAQVSWPVVANWQFRQLHPTDTGRQYPATVPGTVHTDLIANNRIPDPYFGANENTLQWVGKANWVYAANIIITPQQLAYKNLNLVFDGLDTYAEVYINNQLVLAADNMFRTWQVDLKSKLKGLKPGTHNLKIVFTSPITKALPLWQNLGYHLPAGNDADSIKVSPFVRKAPYHFGWDWGPRYVTAGIWRPISLRGDNGISLTSTRYQTTSIAKDYSAATQTAEVEVVSDAPVTATVAVTFGSQKQTKTVNLTKGDNKVPFSFNITRPKLWWCHNVGSPYLYTATAIVSQNGKTIGTKAEKIGVRTVKVDHTLDKDGKSFTVILNGRPVFMKGANYIPPTLFMPTVTPAMYRKQLQQAVMANMNMLRVWGGGTYEADVFYNLADEMGLLLWQDFMFACSMYPGDDAFKANVAAEVEDNVKRLRNHASIALWCGNNEMEQGWFDWGFWRNIGNTKADSAKIWADYKAMFHVQIPRQLAQLDTSRFYTRSSPSANLDVEYPIKTNRKGWGDMHDWRVWFSSVKIDHYNNTVSRFNSEYGFQSFPSYATITTFTKPEDRGIETPVMTVHQKHEGGNAKIKRNMADYYKMPSNFQDFTYLSMLLQADAMKIALQAHRRSRPYCMGTMYWQLNDCWPAVSWASLDYYNNWKATHYIARKANADLLVAPLVSKDSIAIWLVNDSLKTVNTSITIQLKDFSGKVLKNYAEAQPVSLAEGQSKLYAVLKMKDLKAIPNFSDTTAYLVSYLGNANNPYIIKQYCYLSEWKNLNLAKPNIIHSIIVNDAPMAKYTVRLSTNTLAHGVYLQLEGFPNIHFEDNFFDLEAGSTIDVSFSLPRPMPTNMIKSMLKVTSLANTY